MPKDAIFEVKRLFCSQLVTSLIYEPLRVKSKVLRNWKFFVNDGLKISKNGGWELVIGKLLKFDRFSYFRFSYSYWI